MGKLRQERIKVLRMKAYSTDLRQKIIEAYNSEGSFRNIAKRFSVVEVLSKSLQVDTEIQGLYQHSLMEEDKNPS